VHDKYHLVQIPTSPRWYVQWQEGGRSKRRSTGTSDRAEAEGFLSAFRLELERYPVEPIQMAQLLDFYIESRRSEIASIGRAELAARHLKGFYGTALVENCGPSSQRLYTAHRRRQGVKDDTIARELGVMSAAFGFAVKHEKLAQAPAVVMPQKGAAKDRFLTRPEAAKVLRHFRSGWTDMHGVRGRYEPMTVDPKTGRGIKAGQRTQHLLLFTRLGLYTGARSTAILELTWDRVDFRRGLIRYPVPGRRETTKGRAVVPMSPRLRRMLAAAKRAYDQSGEEHNHVIAWRGKPCARIVRAFSSHMDELGLSDVTPHTLRHTCATWAAQNGQPLFLVGKLLGQSVVSTTERYAKHQPEALLAVMAGVTRK
jgi:integrase